MKISYLNKVYTVLTVCGSAQARKLEDGSASHFGTIDMS